MSNTDHQEFKNHLISIPDRKLTAEINKIYAQFENQEDCIPLVTAINRYRDANIPVDYWSRTMDDFTGDKNLITVYNNIVKDLDKTYDGLRICFGGSHGVGKTFVSACILKTAVEKGYSGLYIMLTEIVSLLSARSSEDKQKMSELLKKTDFLVIDEFDQRFMGTENAADLYGRILEPTIRIRLQNRMPLIMCTNSPDPAKSFSGPLKDSISSLMSMVEMIPVMGKDFRKTK